MLKPAGVEESMEKTVEEAERRLWALEQMAIYRLHGGRKKSSFWLVGLTCQKNPNFSIRLASSDAMEQKDSLLLIIGRRLSSNLGKVMSSGGLDLVRKISKGL